MKHTKFIFLILILILILAGCGTKKSDQSAEKNDKNTLSELIVKEGIYNGLADPHTIEVSVDDQHLELQVKEELQSKLKSLTEGDSIQFKYTVNKDKQNELSAIEKIK